jgi:vitamin B12 transporter
MLRAAHPNNTLRHRRQCSVLSACRISWLLIFQRGRLEFTQGMTMKQILLLAGALFGALTLPYAAYADAPMQLLIVTPTRMSQPLDQTIADATVLTEQDIRNSGASDVPTLLRSVAGVDVVQSGGLGKVSSVFMRGTNSNQVLVLLDGVRINSATTGSTALEHIMLDSIERIEVVRGNVSSLYGSEAIGGVIQLFTKRGHGTPAFNAGIGLGSHGTQHLAVGFSGAVDATSFSMNVGKVKTDGISAINTHIAPTANPDKDGYDNTTVDAQVTHAINADHKLSASLFSTRGDSQYDNAYNLATTDQNNTRAAIDKWLLSSDDQLSAMWHSKMKWAQGTDDSKDYLNGVQSSRFQTVNRQLTWQNELKIADAQRVNLTAENLVQSVSSDTLFTRSSRNVDSLLGGYVGEYGSQQMQLNLRQDRYSDFGVVNTGLFGYGLSFADNWRATASISNAFKAPTFNDMYYPLSFGYQGNPDLKPERSKNRELGLHYAANGQRVDAVYFDNRISDLIAINAGYTTVVNINQAQIDGVELSYAGEFGDTHIKANFTQQNPRDTTTGLVLSRRAKQLANFALMQDFGAWGAGVEWQYTGKRTDSYTDPVTFTTTSEVLDGYSLVNLTANYDMSKQYKLSLRADNLFNRDYMRVYSYNTLGRTLFVSLNYRQ